MFSEENKMNSNLQKKEKQKILLSFGICIIALLFLVLMGVLLVSHYHRTFKNMQTESVLNDKVLSKEENANNDWNLMLVNRWNSIPENYNIPLLDIGGGNMVDERCNSDLQNMLSACYDEGLEPLICSSYRSVETQNKLFQEEVDEYLSGGYSKDEAEKMASQVVAYPGTSEHHLGLALDIVDVRNQVLNEEQENTDVQKWLMENSWKYGFILRYPNDKSEITGIIYEPWHYRYVGIEAATEIHNRNICPEEYLKGID